MAETRTDTRVEPQRATFGEMVAAIAGVVLFVALFFDWYAGEDGAGFAVALSAWQALGAIDVILAILAIVPVAEAVLRFTVSPRAEPRVPRALVVAVAGLVALVLAAFRFLDIPEHAGAVSIEGHRVGSLLAIVAAAGIVLGAVAALGERGTAPPWRKA